MSMINPTIQAEFAKPGMNPFFAALAQTQVQPKAETPVQKYYRAIRVLEKIAEQGDMQAWGAQVGQVEVAAQQAFDDPMKLLEAKVQVKKLELSLFLKASKNALQQAEALEKKAKEAELVGDEASRELWMKARQLQQVGKLFQDKLNVRLQTL